MNIVNHDNHHHTDHHQSKYDYHDDNQCQASNNLGAGKHNVSLWEKARQAFKGDSDDYTYDNYVGNDDHDHLHHDHLDHDQVSVSGKGGLKIKTIGFKDSGIYTCMGQIII